MKKRILPWIASITFGLVCASALWSAEYNFKLHHFLPLQAGIPAKFIQPWIEKIEKESDGKIVIQQFPSMQLGGAPPSLANQVKDGTVDFVWTLMGYTPGRFPISEAFELPFMMTTAEATSKAFYEFYEKNMQTEFKDYKIITLHTHGPGIIHSRTAIEKLEDMRGKKLRGPTRTITKLLGVLGAVPIGMPVPKVPESLSKGVLGWCAASMGSYTSLKIQRNSQQPYCCCRNQWSLHRYFYAGDELE